MSLGFERVYKNVVFYRDKKDNEVRLIVKNTARADYDNTMYIEVERPRTDWKEGRMELHKFHFDVDDMGHECGLSVEFRDKYMNPKRNAVVMSKKGRWMLPKEVAESLRTLADWCEELEVDDD